MIKVRSKLISSSVYDIIMKLRDECSDNYFKDVVKHGSEVMCTCPFHSNGQEKHPSFSVHCAEDEREGVFHCFTCGESGNMTMLVQHCLKLTDDDAEDWLIERFNSVFLQTEEVLPEINISYNKKHYLDESCLEEYKYMHPYMFKRRLNEEVIRKFKLGCTPDGAYITFPCWDIHGNLVGIFKRSTTTKEFIIPKGIDKPIYLLNYIVKENITDVIICESAFNALTCWVYGYPAVCLFGTGTRKQYDVLKHCGIRSFHLALDGDTAGHRGTNKIIDALGNSAFVDVICIPDGKDVNDLSKEEFESLSRVDSYDWKKYNS